jgi:hypothetical protein
MRCTSPPSVLARCASRRIWRLASFAAASVQPLVRRLPDDLATIDLLLIDPVIDRRLGHPERHNQLRDTRPRTSKLNDLTTRPGE